MTTLNEKATTLIQRLKTANEWRRGAEIEMPNPEQLGEDIDDAIKLIESFRWRYVNVELPKIAQLVLIQVDNDTMQVSTARYKGNGCFAIDYADFSYESITHWRPIETI